MKFTTTSLVVTAAVLGAVIAAPAPVAAPAPWLRSFLSRQRAPAPALSATEIAARQKEISEGYEVIKTEAEIQAEEAKALAQRRKEDADAKRARDIAVKQQKVQQDPHYYEKVYGRFTSDNLTPLSEAEKSQLIRKEMEELERKQRERTQRAEFKEKLAADPELAAGYEKAKKNTYIKGVIA